MCVYDLKLFSRKYKSLSIDKVSNTEIDHCMLLHTSDCQQYRMLLYKSSLYIKNKYFINYTATHKEASTTYDLLIALM